MLSLISKDLETLEYVFMYSPIFIQAPLELLVVVLLLWQLVGIEIAAAIGYLSIILMFNFAIGRILRQIRVKMTRTTDLRLKLLCDVVAGIRVIKMNVLETLMERVIGQARR